MHRIMLLLTIVLLTASTAAVWGRETESTTVESSAAAPTSQLPVLPGYSETQRITSPHATQAAVADGERLYAISNTTVATYDRVTGELLATASAAGVGTGRS